MLDASLRNIESISRTRRISRNRIFRKSPAFKLVIPDKNFQIEPYIFSNLVFYYFILFFKSRMSPTSSLKKKEFGTYIKKQNKTLTCSTTSKYQPHYFKRIVFTNNSIH